MDPTKSQKEVLIQEKMCTLLHMHILEKILKGPFLIYEVKRNWLLIRCFIYMDNVV